MTNQTVCQSYILCSSPRSGTTLLCDLLRQTGVAGAPESFFRQKSFEDWCRAWGVSQVYAPGGGFDPEYLKAARVAGQGGTDVFGLRLMGTDLEVAIAGLAPHHADAHNDKEVFDAVFGATRYIHLSRVDKLAEAVSYVRAEQTGLWHSRPDGTDIERIQPMASDGYDEAALTHRMTILAGLDAAWHQWFAAHQIKPLRLTYESLAKDPLETLRKVLEYIGKDPEYAMRARPGTRKLADAVSKDWIERYRRGRPT